MDSILLLPAATLIPAEALPELDKLIETCEYATEYDDPHANQKDLAKDKPTWLFSREGTTKIVAKVIALGKKFNFPIGIQLDGTNEDDTYEWEDISFLTWFDHLEKKEIETPCSRMGSSPRWEVGKILKMLTDPKEAEDFRSQLKVLELIGATKPNALTKPFEKEITAAVDLFDPKNHRFLPSPHTITACITREGARIRLGNSEEYCGDEPDVFVEARKDGWHIFAHENETEEPSATIHIGKETIIAKQL